jgi:hypothetical protein
MRRRDFLIGGAAAMAAMAYPSPSRAQSTASQLRFIDAHCHIFNFRDLPVEGFIKKVALPNNSDMRRIASRYPEVADVFVHFLNTKLRDRAPDHSSELTYIDQIENGANPPDPAQTRSDDIDFLRSVLGELFANKIARGETLKFGDRTVTGLTIEYLEQKMVEEAYPLVVNPTRSVEDGGVNYFENNYEPLAKEIFASQGPIGLHIRWAFLFTRHRFELADELAENYAGRAVLLTPALVDLGAWLQEEPAVSVHQQIDVMARLSLRKNGPRVHGFVAFDPLRQAVHEKHGRPEGDSPLSTARRAIEEHGFVGVKLYPPMGFRATNNALAGTDFPELVRFGPDGLGSEPGKRIDEVMDSLVAWCAGAEVPILTHAANSNEAGPGYGTLMCSDVAVCSPAFPGRTRLVAGDIPRRAC